MSVSVALSAAAIASSLEAAERAQHAEAVACSKLVSGYQHETATVEQRQTYASCVQTLNPRHDWLDSVAGVIFVKAMIIAAIIGATAGIWNGSRDRYLGGFVGAVTIGFVGLLSGPTLVLLAYGTWYGVKFVIGAT
jgi:hypothetical protein